MTLSNISIACAFSLLASPVFAEGGSVPLAVFNFNPHADVVEEGAVSEFEWAIDQLDDICDTTTDTYMEPICKELSDIGFDINSAQYGAFHDEALGAELSNAQISDALHIAARLQYQFRQVSLEGNVKSCNFDNNMECITIHSESEGVYRTFAFPYQPA
jgi:hypothetical protein